jgi:hypothetical protein
MGHLGVTNGGHGKSRECQEGKEERYAGDYEAHGIHS